MKRTLQIIVTFIISAVFLWFAVKDLDWEVAISSLSSINIPLLLSALILWLSGYILRAYRWKIFFTTIKLPTLDSFKSLIIGFAANNSLPLRAGEIIRAYILKRLQPSISISQGFATVAGERLFDGIAIVAITIWSSQSINLADWAHTAIIYATVLFGVAFVMFILIARYTNASVGIFRRLFSFLPFGLGYKLIPIAEQFLEGLVVLQSFKLIGRILVYSLITWLIESTFYYYSIVSFGIDINFMQAAFLMGIINLGIMVPAGPGGVGTFEFITVATLGFIGVNESLAFSYAVVAHILENGSVILIGVYYLMKMGIGVKEISKKATGGDDTSG